MNTVTDTRSISLSSSARLPAIAALAFGFFLFLATGFAWPSAVHNATHDTRHALGLPCH